MQPLDQGAAQACQTALHGVEYVEVGDEDTDYRGEIRRAPVAMDIGFACTDRAVTGNQSPDGRIADPDFGAQIALWLAEMQGVVAFLDQQQAMLQVFQLAQHGAPQQAGTNAVAAAYQASGGGQARAFHGACPSRAGGQH